MPQDAEADIRKMIDGVDKVALVDADRAGALANTGGLLVVAEDGQVYHVSLRPDRK